MAAPLSKFDLWKKTVPVPRTFSDPLEHRAFLKFRLAQAYRIFGKYGFDEGVAGHILSRTRSEKTVTGSNPWGVHFKFMQPEDLILVDQAGNIQENESGPSRWLNGVAFLIHSAIHQARPDVVCIAHSHTTYAKAFGTLGIPLDPLTQDSCAFYKDHALYDEFNGIVDDIEEGVAIANALGSKKAVILQNHGILVSTESIESTVYFFISLEKCCQAQMTADQAAAARGIKTRLIDPASAAQTYEYLGSELWGNFAGMPEFDLLEQEEGKRFEYVPAPKETA
ncbi:class II aldolase/adducin domain-containing protein [Suillus fuscotomentosus]|uniref:Class II aldolase/adducin domain-containing protein n=1 Tax=Suillus fuscotomentosus TaxID=1912939 RepID=A0AAD4DUV3_9AGAM|nr:class II aldolase/adducin domain-containing protein [Suillus fuscotomentosus]KAG1894241.1 class II aldolase/adducin domain-containing protein [Suillus fuscotomentosus]